MQKFKYKTDLFFDAMIDLKLLGFILSPEYFGQINDYPHHYEHLARFATDLSPESYDDFMKT
jgi:hypothetical protein